MRFEERDLNLYEIAIARFEEAKASGRRISSIYMTQDEFDSFYQLAMNSLPSTETAGFIHRKEMFGAQIVIEEAPKKSKREK